MTGTIKEQLTLIFDGDPWYGGSINKVLASVNRNHIFDRPGNNVHSIAEIVTHMYMYRKFAERRLQGGADTPPEQERTFVWESISTEKKQFWQTMLKELQRNQRNLCQLLDQADEEIFDQKVPGKSYTFYYLLTGIIQHDLYHLGQIVYINKWLQNNRTGKKGGFPGYSFHIFSYEDMCRIK